MIVLGIESSCDESAAAVVENGRTVLSSVVFSQVPLHRPYGGVVPEIASRSHVEKIGGVVREAVEQAFGGLAWERIDAVAATFGPGLASSLMVGWSAAKGIALALGKPLIAVNHMQAHLHSPFLSPEAPDPASLYPMLGMAVSGGHSCWLEMARPGSYRVIGQTIDDAAGEAFDKAAKLLDLGYPGGPVIDRIAKTAPGKLSIDFPRGRPKADNPALGNLNAELCVSFSGLKTSLMYYLKKNPPQSPDEVADIVSCYQKAIVGALADHCARALELGRYKAVTVGGGVSLNGALRARLKDVCARAGVQLLLAEPRFCGDNAAMIAGLAGAGGGRRGETLALDIDPALPADA